MIIEDIVKELNLKIIAGKEGLKKEITGVYIGDLLSFVMSHAKKGNAWITIQTHVNVIAVATLLELSCIIVPEDTEIDEDTIKHANDECIPVLLSSKSAYEISIIISDIIRAKDGTIN